MFVLTLLADSIRIPPTLLAKPTLTSVQTEIDKRYPNKIIVDVGLIIAPYGPPLQIGDGILVPGDGGAHHQVLFQCVVFRPFVEEVLVGKVTESHEGGVVVNVGGFFAHVFIPAYWMLNPSVFDEGTGLWVWTPTYDDDDDDEDDGEKKEGDGGAKEDASTGGGIKREDGGEETETTTTMNDANGEEEGDDAQEEDGTPDNEEEEEDGNRFEIEIGSEIRFKVKAVNFTRITTTMKGVQATTTTTSHSSTNGAFGLNGDQGGTAAAKAPSSPGGTNGNTKEENGGPVRQRSSSADLSDQVDHPAPMQIVGSICEDGLGLVSWWKQQTSAEEEDDDEENGEGEDGLEEEGE